MLQTSWFIWGRVIFLVGGVFLLSHLVPSQPLDPWGILNLRKFFQLIGALLLIQVLGVFSVRFLGRRHGLLLTGFLGGIVSSTALTVSLARRHVSSSQKIPAEILPFLGATLAMLCEAFLLVYLGTEQFRWELSLLFLGPILFTVTAIGFLLKRHLSFNLFVENERQVDFFGTMKLVVFIMGILAVSKIVQNFAGQSGLQVLTFVVSLFEIHGSVISNTQLYEAKDVSLWSLGLLLAISIAASYVSKIFLVFTFGSAPFKKYVGFATLGVFLVLASSFLFFHYLVL